MTTEPYVFIDKEDIKTLSEFTRKVAQLRQKDIEDFTNLTNVFISGRKVGKIPTGSSDVASSDRIGDFNYDASYIYILVDNAGTPVWRRATLGSW